MTHHPATVKQRSPRFKFIANIIGELKKVVWLSKREAAYLTALVLIVALVVGLALGGFDFAFSGLVNKLLLGG